MAGGWSGTSTLCNVTKKFNSKIIIEFNFNNYT